MQSALHFLEWQIVRPNFDAMPMRRERGDERIKDLSQYKSLASKLVCGGRCQGPTVGVQTERYVDMAVCMSDCLVFP